MRIGELADLVGISARAIRHYRHLGLLAEPARKANGYREYSLRDAVELARVRRLAELGLSLDEVGDALAGDADRDLVEILRELDADLARQEAGLRRRRARLARLLRQAEAGGEFSGQAPVSRASRAVRPHGPRRRGAARAGAGDGSEGPRPDGPAGDRVPGRAHGWLAVLTQTLNSDPGPPKGPTPSTPASTSWQARPRMTPGSRRRPRPSSRPSRRPARPAG